MVKNQQWIVFNLVLLLYHYVQKKDDETDHQVLSSKDHSVIVGNAPEFIGQVMCVPGLKCFTQVRIKQPLGCVLHYCT